MKKALRLILTAILCISCIILMSCGNTSIRGDLQSYSNADNSFSIDLPTADEDFWLINEEAPSSVLDISDSSDTVNILVQCISKNQAQPVATDLSSYMDYSMINVLGDILIDTDMSESSADVPDFISNSLTYEFSLSGDAKGIVLFMESDKCYYTYFIMAVNDAYSGNENALLDSIMSLKEVN